MQAAIDRLRNKFNELVPLTDPTYIPAHDTIKAMAGLAKMLYSPMIEEILAELEDYGGTTLGELLAFMHAYNLRFAAANSFRQRRIYMKLYPMLLEQVNGSHRTTRPERVAGSRRGRIRTRAEPSRRRKTWARRLSPDSSPRQSISSRTWTGST